MICAPAPKLSFGHRIRAVPCDFDRAGVLDHLLRDRLDSGRELAALVDVDQDIWRFAPGWEADHDQAGLEASFAKVGELDAAAAATDCAKALVVLGDLDEVTGTPGVMGFCLGGTLAWAVAAGGGPSVCVSYYGSGVPAMLEQIDNVTCPTLFHFGNADAYIPKGTFHQNNLLATIERLLAGRDAA